MLREVLRDEVGRDRVRQRTPDPVGDLDEADESNDVRRLDVRDDRHQGDRNRAQASGGLTAKDVSGTDRERNPHAVHR